MADPFVLRHANRYYAYGTAPKQADGRHFPVLESSDLINWQPRGGALIPPGGDEFWAPEVAYQDGLFYLYYSVRGLEGRDHHLRVATSKQPIGPFTDCSLRLVPDEPFTIDAHPYRDVDGTWYLFYSQDFLSQDGDWRVGTGIVVDRMVSMTALEGKPQLVVRPFADWQLFQSQRAMYDNVYDWYTIEGAALRVHNGRYYCFYSGGAWERENYGVSYVVAEHPLGPYQRVEGLPLIRSIPAQVIGPGHNSFTHAPNEEEVIVYHGWDAEKQNRLMRVDRLLWNGDKPIINGPTWTPQPSFSSLPVAE
ncbi:MAG: glycoside hydrolase family 43 protein [Anaerolineae bacterium]|nr:glycoside hydrolase family 43 protein [Anaerolineae bacterium]